ncbi:MAG: hypothetical protein R3332_06065 [Pseudohongiellaceae bacterium]|nr:hypothetical protein [Pseudohongiellaceae bacterium]
MSCERTSEIVASFFDDALAPVQRQANEAHVSSCAHCRVQLADARLVQARLASYKEEAVPNWSRSAVLAKEKPKTNWRDWLGAWQWAPLACSFLLALGVVFNVEISSSDSGFVVAFGQSSGVSQQELDQRIQKLSASLERQQGDVQLQMLETVVENVMRQYDENSSRNLEQVIEYFDLQRQQDLQLLQSSYQQLADSDYETIRSVQQLASYVQYQGLE